MAQRQVNGRLYRFGTGNLKTETRQGLTGHQLREFLGERNPQWMLPLEAVAFMGGVHRLNNLRVTVPQRIGGPAALEIDIAVVVEIPDIIPFGSTYNHLGRRIVAHPGCPPGIGGITQAIAQMRQPSLQ